MMDDPYDPEQIASYFPAQKGRFRRAVQKNFDAAIRTEKSPAGGPDGKR
jgi:hypothetical protein